MNKDFWKAYIIMLSRVVHNGHKPPDIKEGGITIGVDMASGTDYSPEVQQPMRTVSDDTKEIKDQREV